MDFDLTAEQLELRDLARQFAREEIVPASLEYDAKQDPAQCYSPKLMARASELGLRTLAIPREFGGREADTLTQVLVLEELCAGDIGFGMSIQHAWREGYALAAMTTPEQRDRYLPDFLSDPTYLTSNAVTEAHFGSDAAASSSDPADGPRTIAERRGESWILNGSKRWITNANHARMILTLARTDKSVLWRDGCTYFLVPSNSPGLRIGRIEDKSGIRMNTNAEIIYENCEIPADNMLGAFNKGKSFGSKMSHGSRVKTAAKSLGVAVAAYEEAVKYARERVQGGRPIIKHQAISAALVDIEIGIQTARSLMYRAAWAVAEDRPESSRLESLAKIWAAEMALRATASAVEIHGAYGIMRGTRIEKLMRDASCLSHLGRALHASKANLGGVLDSDAVSDGVGGLN